MHIRDLNQWAFTSMQDSYDGLTKVSSIILRLNCKGSQGSQPVHDMEDPHPPIKVELEPLDIASLHLCKAVGDHLV